ncbi:12288_t:CDS:1, partial [Funneliformis caledonium]
MEYNFISKATLDDIINKYISSLPDCRQEKALVNMNLFKQIKKILLNPFDKEIDTKTTREWAKKCFILEEITPGDYRIIVKKDNKP